MDIPCGGNLFHFLKCRSRGDFWLRCDCVKVGCGIVACLNEYNRNLKQMFEYFGNNFYFKIKRLACSGTKLFNQQFNDLLQRSHCTNIWQTWPIFLPLLLLRSGTDEVKKFNLLGYPCIQWRIMWCCYCLKHALVFFIWLLSCLELLDLYSYLVAFFLYWNLIIRFSIFNNNAHVLREREKIWSSHMTQPPRNKATIQRRHQKVQLHIDCATA